MANGVKLPKFGCKALRQLATDSFQRKTQVLSTVHSIFGRVIIRRERIQSFLDVALRRIHAQDLLDLLV